MTRPFRPLRRWLDAALGYDERATRHREVFAGFAQALSRAARAKARRRARIRGARA